MSRVLEVALAEVAKLPPGEQDALGALLLEEMWTEGRWSGCFAASQNTLKELADVALAEHRAGKTKPLIDSL